MNDQNILKVVSARDVSVNETNNLTLDNSTISGALTLTGYSSSLDQVANSTVLVTGTTTFSTFYGTNGINLPSTNNKLGPLAINNSYGQKVYITENDPITQASAWSLSSSDIRLQTANDQAITLDKNNSFYYLTLTQSGNASAPGDVLVTTRNNDLYEQAAWTTHGFTHLDLSSGYQVYLPNLNNILGPLQITNGTGPTTIYAKNWSDGTSSHAAIMDDATSGRQWSTGQTTLYAYDSSASTTTGTINLTNQSNVLGNLGIQGGTVTITEGHSITDQGDAYNSGGAWITTGATTLNAYGGAVTLDNTSNSLGPLAVNVTGGSPVQITDNTDLTQSAAWHVGTSAVTLNSMAHAIDLSTSSGNVLGDINITTTYGRPTSVKIKEDDAITQGAAAWDLTGKPVTLIAENDKAITLTNTANQMGNLAITGGDVTITENAAIVQGATVADKWTTTGTTTLNSLQNAITLENTGNMLGNIAITVANGTPASVSITEDHNITQASAWLLPTKAITLNSQTHDVILDNVGNQLGALTITGANATVTENHAITNGDAWTVSGLATLNATGNTITLDNSANDFGSLKVSSASIATVTDANALVLDDITASTRVALTSGGAITQKAGTAITVPSLSILGSGSANLPNTGNNVATFAASFSGGDLIYTDHDNFTVGNVNGVSGISVGAHNVTLVSDTGTISGLSTVDSTSSSLTVQTATGLTLQSMTIGGAQTYTAGGSGITLNAGITSDQAGAITFNSPVTLGADLSIQSHDSAINFNGDITGASKRLTVNAGDGAVEFKGTLSNLGLASSASPALDVSSTTGTHFYKTVAANNGISISGPVTFDDDIFLGDGTAGSVFSGMVTFAKAGGLAFSGYDGIAFKGGVTLSGNTSIDSKNSTLTFENNSIDGAYGLTLNAGTGTIVGLDKVGSHLTSLDVTGYNLIIPSGGATLAGPQTYTATGGTSVVLNGNVASTLDSTGTITFNSPVLIGDNVTVSTANSAINFNGKLDGDHNLTVNSGTAPTEFKGMIGSLSVLGSGTGAALTVGGSGAAIFDETVKTNAGISIAGPATLTKNLTIDTGDTGSTIAGAVTLAGDLTINANAGNLAFNSTINGAHALTVDGSGTTTFGGAVGSNAALTSLTTDAGGTTAINGGSVTTTGSQAYHDAVTLGADTTLTGVAINLANTVNGAHTLIVNDSGTTTLGGAVTVASLTTDAGGTTTINGGSVTTTGSQAYHDAVTLGADTTLTGVAINLAGTVDGAHALTVNDSGTTTFAAAIGGNAALTSLTTDAGGTTAINGGSVTTTGSQAYHDAVTLGADTTLTGVAINLANTVNGAHTLIVNDSGTTTLGGAVTVASLTTDAGGTTAINGGSVTTTGSQVYHDAVTLGADTTLTGVAINLAGTVDGAHALAINDSGTTTFGGAVGGNAALTSLTTDAAGTTAINGGSIRTTGSQTYNDAVTLGANATLTGIGNTFNDTVNGGHALTVNDSGTTTFVAAIGGNVALTSLTTDAGGTTAINGGSVTTTGSQAYHDAVTLGSNTTLTGVDVNLAGTVDGAHALAINDSGTTTFGGAVGGNAALTSLTTDAAGTTAIDGGSIRTTGSQTYNDAVTLGANATLTGIGNTFNDTVNGGHALTVNDSGTTTFAAAIGGNAALTSLTTDAGGTTAINGGSVTTTGSQAYHDAVTLGADTTLTGVAINLANTVNGAHTLIVNDSGITTLGGAVTVTSLTTDAGGTTAINGGSVTTTGSQAYHDAVALGADTTLTGVAINLAGTVDGAHALAINDSGTTTFGGAVGGNAALTSLTTDAAGTTAINGGSIRTTGAQAYNGAVTLGANAVITSTGGGVSFDAINGGYNLTVNAPGQTTFNGVVGGVNALNSINTDAAGTLRINTTAITTTGGQTFRDAMILGADLSLNSGNGVAINNTVDGAHSLVIAGGNGAVSLTGAIGGTTPLTALTVNNNAALSLAAVNTSGAQIYNSVSAITVTGDLSGNGLTFNDPVDVTVNGRTINAGTGNLVFGDTVNAHAHDLTLSTSGAASQFAAITAGGLELLGAGGVYNLDTVSNSVGRLAGATGTVKFRNDGDFAIGTVNSSGLTATGSVVLESAGTVTQTQALSAAALGLKGTGAYELTANNNSIATLAADTGSINLHNNRALNIGTVNPTGIRTTGDFTLVNNGAITQDADAPLTIGGDLTLETTHNAGDVQLNNTGSGTTEIGNTLIGGNYDLTATARPVTQASGSSLQVAGNLNVAAGDVSLNGSGNLIGGSISTTGLTILRQAGVITLGDITESGQYMVVSEASNKSFGAAIHGPAITLNNAANNIGGTISLKTVSPTVIDSGEVKTGINQLAGTKIVVNGATTFIAEPSSIAGSGVINLTNAGNEFGPLTLSGTTVAVTESIGNTAITSANATSLTIVSSGAVTQAGAITTGDVTVTAGANQMISLNSPDNVITGVARLNGGAINLVDGVALQLGAVNATGAVNIATLGGNLTLADSVVTSNATDSAIILNAGQNSAAGTAGGGDIIISGGSVAVGAGGRATLYSGSVADTSLATLIGAGTGHFRYNSDESATHYNTILGTGAYAIYREQPTITLTANNATSTYGGTPVLSVTAGGTVNGDTTAQAVSGATFAIGGAKSTSDNYIAGDHAISVTGVTSDLGYAVNNSYTDGLLTVNKAALTISGITASDKVYDRTAAATVSASGAVFGGLIAGDLVSVSATGLFSDKNAANGKIVTLTSSYGGADLGNYNVTDQAFALANITPKAMTISGIMASDKVYDGNRSATISTSGVSYTGLISGDDVSVLATGLFSDKNAAIGKTVTLTSGYSGADKNNYTITDQATTTASISRKDLVVSSIGASSKVYDGTRTATVTGGAITSGVIAGDDVTLTSVSGTFADKNVGNGKTVTISGGQLGGADAGNYNVTGTDTAIASITPASLTISGITASNKTYDGNRMATVSTAGVNYTGLITNDDVTVSATGLFSDKNAGNGKTVTLSSGYSGADIGNYTITDQATATANITPKALTISGITASNKTYDGNRTATVSTAGVNYTGLITNDDVTVSATGLFSDKNAGNGKTVTLSSGYSGADIGNYTITDQASSTANISRKDLTVSSVTASNKVYDGNSNATITGGTITAGVVSGDTVTLSSLSGAFADKNVGNGKAVTITGGLLGGADAGNYNVTVLGAASANITPASLTISGITASDKTYDGNSNATILTGAVNYTGLISGDDVTVVATGQFSDKNAGSGKTVTLTSGYSGADKNNYTITDQAATTASISKKDLVVSSIGANDKVYDGIRAAVVTGGAITSGVIAGDNVTLSSVSGTFADKNVGAGKIVTISGGQLGGADAGNYNVTGTDIAVANITPAALTVSGITASDKIYDGNRNATVSTGGASLTGLISGDDVTISATGLFSDKNAGSGKTVALTSSYGGVDKGNYTITDQAATTASISKKDLVVSSIGANDKVYDGTRAAVVTGGAITSGVIAGDNVTLSSVSGTFADKNVGAGKIVTISGGQLGGADAGNYNVTGTDIAVANITPAALTVSGITASDKIYDGNRNATVSTGGASLTGLISGDDVTISATGLFSDKNAGSGKTVTLTSSYGGVDQGNYTITDQTATTASISKKDLVISSVSASDKVYDGTRNATITGGAITSGVIAGDDVTLSSVNGTFADKNVGNGKTVTISGGQLGGVDAGNYNVTGAGSVTADITPASLTISGITASDKTYDGNRTATISTSGVSYTGLISGDDVTVVATGLFSDKNAGNGKTVTLTSGYDGVDKNNYTITDQATTTANISKKDLVVSSVGASDKVYDGTRNATITGGAITSGVVTGDDVTLSSVSGTFADKNVGNNKAVTISGGQLSGADAGNYNVTGTDTVTADITPKVLDVDSVHAASKVYDGSTTATITGGTITSGVVTGDDVTLSSLSGVFSDKNAATGKIVTISGGQLTGVDAGNYLVATVATTTADITRRTLIVSATGQSKTYDGTTAATVTFADDRVSGDSLNVSGASVFSDRNAGTGKAILLSGLSFSGADANNYQLLSNTGFAVADINRAALVINAASDTKTYDGTTASSATPTHSILAAGDSISALTQTFGSRNVQGANNSLLSVGGFTINDGAGGRNYDVTVNSASGTITKAALTITAQSDTKTYDGTLTAAATPTCAGLQSGDTVNGLAEIYTSKNAGSGKTLTVSGYTINDGNSGNNYTVSTVDETNGIIGQKVLSLSSISADNKVYDGTATATIRGGNVSGIISGEDVSLTSLSGTFSDKNVANGKVVTLSGGQLSGLDSGNYTISTAATTTADITRRTLIVSATGQNKTYDGTTAAMVSFGDNRITGDSLTVTGTSAFGDKDAGTGKAILISGLGINGVDANNYQLLSNSGFAVATINKASLTVTALNASKAYDGLAYYGGNGVAFSGFVTSETSAVLSGSLVYGGTSQGAISTGNYVISPTGLSSGNYSISFVNGALSILSNSGPEPPASTVTILDPPIEPPQIAPARPLLASAINPPEPVFMDNIRTVPVYIFERGRFNALSLFTVSDITGNVSVQAVDGNVPNAPNAAPVIRKDTFAFAISGSETISIDVTVQQDGYVVIESDHEALRKYGENEILHAGVISAIKKMNFKLSGIKGIKIVPLKKVSRMQLVDKTAKELVAEMV